MIGINIRVIKIIKPKITNWGIRVGTKIEMEHTNSKKVARKIAMDHLHEFGNRYYVELQKMEKRLSRK